ncbi:MAG: hypothetical protein JXQ77_00080 [Campylobacterales bacterium]|nr:hypothetical protein [Campylobacterales bacterium]
MLKKLIILVVSLLVIIAVLVGLSSKEIFKQEGYFAKSTNGLNVGSNIDFTLPNQHDEQISLSDDTKKVIFVFAKSTGHTVKQYLSTQPSDFLTSKDMLFVADISPMPVAIRNLMAMPDLKKSSYSVLLTFEPTLTEPFMDESKKDKIIIVTLDRKQITNVVYAIDEKELIEAIK